MKATTSLLAAGLVLALTACATTGNASRNGSASLQARSGSQVTGSLAFMPMGDGLHLTGEVRGLTAGGTHAIHVHENGDCSAADGSSAGGHFNPAGAAHGRMNSANHHVGDMDNLVANANGVAEVNMHLSAMSLGTGAANDVLGKAVIVHAAADDYTTQPTGNAGGRLACGVISH